MTQPHHRRPDESVKAFAAFTAYLGLGPQRSCEKAAELVGKHAGTLRKWSERHGWVARSAAYEELRIDQERQIAKILTQEKSAEWIARQEQIKEKEWAAAEEAIELCRELMRKMAFKASLGDIAKLLDVASKLGRLSSGLETDRRELTGEGGGPIQVAVDIGPALKRVYGRRQVGNSSGPETGEVVQKVIDVGSAE